MLRQFILPADQIDRLREAGGPLAEQTDLTYLASKGSVAVVELDGQIVAYWVVFYALHAEPLWVSLTARHNAAVLRALVQQLEQLLDNVGDPVGFAIIQEDEILEQGAKYARRVGFKPVPGTLYYLIREPIPDPVKG